MDSNDLKDNKNLRILIATHAPLSAEFGAGQMAINLADAFRSQGHKVILWSHPQTEKVRSFRIIPEMKRSFEFFLRREKSFDIIDTPSFLVPSSIPNSTIIVARSVQPDILYTFQNLLGKRIENLKEFIRLPLNVFLSFQFLIFVLIGWKRADFILCLGKIEWQWMKKYFPWWKNKLNYYVNALSKKDQKALTQIRKKRKKIDRDKISLLWIGRWTNHKGIKELTNYIEQCVENFSSLKFTIAGCGNQAEKSFSPNVIKSGRLEIIPFFERDKLSNLLSKHDIGLFTSRVEGWGLVLNEMLESGMPVLATKTGGVIDLQSYFKDKIFQFPLIDFSKIIQTKSKSHLDEYYATFSWEKIAENYILMLLTNKKRNFMD